MSRAIAERAPADADLLAVWARASGGVRAVAGRPDYRFDPAFYAATYGDVPAEEAAAHYAARGRAEGRHPNGYTALAAQVPDLDARLARLVVDPALSDLLAAGRGAEVAFELLALGDPVDARLSDFSAVHYLGENPDVAAAGVAPLAHYLRFGLGEGRRCLRAVRGGHHAGATAFDPARPTVLICVHEMSRTGAPIVARDLAREAAETANVAVLSPRDGELRDAFLETSCGVVISQRFDAEWQWCRLPVFGAVDRAILNSVEAWGAIPALVRRGIPFAAYVHEFTDYSLPRYKPLLTALFADCLVFSSDRVRASWSGLFTDIGFDPDRDSIVLPQRALTAGRTTAEAHAAGRARLGRMLRRDLTGARVILGAGHTQWRKGTDLFAQAAQVAERTAPDAVFVWVGDGLNHEDVNFGVWMTQAVAARGNLHVLPAGPHYADALRAADAMFLSSRLDPLPNVVFDAVETGLPVVLFAGATGFDDARYADHASLTAVPLGDVAAAVAALTQVPARAARAEWGAEAPDAGAVPVYAPIVEALAARTAGTEAPAGEIDVPVLFTPDTADGEARAAERAKMAAKGRRYVWPDVDAARAALDASDNWVHANVRLAPRATSTASRLPVSVHIHAHYLDGLEEVLRSSGVRRAAEVLVTTDTQAKANQIAGLGAAVRVLPNRGRDILPFLSVVAEGPEDRVWAHLHQKRSVASAPDGETWRRFLTQILVGADAPTNAADLALTADVGLVAAFDPYAEGWGGARRLVGTVAGALPGPLPPHPLLFPLGNMFWVKARVARRMLRIFGADYPWPGEPLADDGTVYHLIERLWPAATAAEGLAQVYLYDTTVRRR